jgi:hydroxyacylglutathione hydrolase
MHIERIVVGPFEVNAYLAWGSGPEALVVDPGADAPRLLKALEARRLTVAAYLLTHGHADHVSALGDMYRQRPAPFVLRREDREWTFSPVNQLPPYYPGPGGLPADASFLADEGELALAGLRLQSLATPGHTPGGASFYFPGDGVLFSGDTLFQGSVGRTDFPGGSSRVLSRSLAELARLPEATRVLPGHGEETTIGVEKRTNLFLRAK